MLKSEHHKEDFTKFKQTTIKPQQEDQDES